MSLYVAYCHIYYAINRLHAPENKVIMTSKLLNTELVI
jgi:hypothetical protein